MLTGLDRGLLTALAGFRWAAWAWMAAVALFARDDLEVTWLSPALIGAAFAATAAGTALLRRRPVALLQPPAVVVELLCGAALLLGDGWAYGADPVGAAAPPALGSVWPVSGVLAAGVAFGPLAGAVAGAALGLANVAGKLAAGDPGLGGQVVSVLSTGVQLTLAGAAIGYAARRVRVAEREVAEARAREEVARTLHDGVLQTLAVIQRRADDPVLARMAREQERDLRGFLFGTGAAVGDGGDLGASLRQVAATFEDRYGGKVDVVVADDVPSLPAPVVGALAGAAGEAVTNAGKHGDATRVTIYVEPAGDGGVFCSVKDDGRGFDPDGTPAGVGLSRSIRGRIADVGGRSEVSSRPGMGTEVRLWVG